MMGIMQELGLQVTKFDSIVNRFNNGLSTKSYVLIEGGTTEDKARFKQQYQLAEVSPSFHNFVVLSHTKKVVEILNSERRFFMLCCVDLHYSQEKQDSLWALIKGPSIHELFFH
ncbi:TPA: hypothetical protein ACH3X3_003315 [Trebouxia sp. C0006]